MHSQLIIWFNPKKQLYYHRINKGWYKHYEVGDKNSYGHTVFYVVNGVDFFIRKDPFIKRFLRKLIVSLENLERRF